MGDRWIPDNRKHLEERVIRGKERGRVYLYEMNWIIFYTDYTFGIVSRFESSTVRNYVSKLGFYQFLVEVYGPGRSIDSNGTTASGSLSVLSYIPNPSRIKGFTVRLSK